MILRATQLTIILSILLIVIGLLVGVINGNSLLSFYITDSFITVLGIEFLKALR